MEQRSGGTELDVLVIGGGPAGSTVSTLLARKGWRVGLFEKERHPRFHIGESLLPCNLPIFERLGVLADVARIGVPKLAADFSMPDSAAFTRVDFSKALRPIPPSAFQVRRSEFDHLLLRKAAESGVAVAEETRVMAVDLDRGSRVHVHASNGNGSASEWTARFLIDASGRDTFLGRQLDLKKRHPKHTSAAIYGHFEGVEHRPGADSGNISIYWFRHGWIWLIPLTRGVMSVGVVAKPGYFKNRERVASALDEALALCPPARARMAGARLIGELTTTGNYSYSCDRMYGPNYLLLGDAFAFVDPVFSSGVFIAMSTAEGAAEAVHVWLNNPAAGTKLFRALERRVRRGIDRFWWFIDRFNEPALQALFMRPVNVLGARTAVLSTLAGDIFGNWRLAFPLVVFRMLYKMKSWAGRRALGRNTGAEHVASERNLQA